MPYFNHGAYLSPRLDKIDYEAEENYQVFRYMDLSEKAREKFAKWIKKKGSIWTLRSTPLKDIQYTLGELNPILISPGWGGGFAYSSIYRWRERAISSMIYNSLYRRNPAEGHKWTIDNLLCTPVDALKRAGRTFRCRGCSRDLSYEHEGYHDRECRDCYHERTSIERQEREQAYAKRATTTNVRLSELRRDHRPPGLRGGRHQLWLGVWFRRLRRLIPGLSRW